MKIFSKLKKGMAFPLKEGKPIYIVEGNNEIEESIYKEIKSDAAFKGMVKKELFIPNGLPANKNEQKADALLKNAEDEATSIMEKAQEKADKMAEDAQTKLDKATEDAAQIVADAEVKATDIKAKAQAKADKIAPKEA